MWEPEISLDIRTKALHNGELVDRVIFALAKSTANLKLESADKKVLLEAAEFLKKVKAGYDWIHNPIIDHDSMTHAFYFETAATSWLNKTTAPAQFIDEIDLMINIINDLINDKDPDAQLLQATRQFFNVIFQRTINRLSHLDLAIENSRFM